MRNFIRIVFFVIVGIVAVIMLVAFFIYLVSLIKGKRRKKRVYKSEYKKRNIFLRVFWDLPKSLVRDYFDKDPDAMSTHGVWLFCGPQGSGKTIAAIEMLSREKKLHPAIKIRSNIGIDFQDGKITDWRDVAGIHNGRIGQIDFIDELQNWFASNDFKNFPVEMLEEVTQERKEHKVIIGTSQVFTRVNKSIREQVHYLCCPFTLFGCMTIVPVYKPVVDDSGTLKKKKFLRVYMFVHTDELRNSYDTYERVQRLLVSGFADKKDK